MGRRGNLMMIAVYGIVFEAFVILFEITVVRHFNRKDR